MAKQLERVGLVVGREGKTRQRVKFGLTSGAWAIVADDSKARRIFVISGDDTRLRQVLGNLVRNALVHTPATTPIEIGVTTVNGTARLSVVDHGPGLKAGDLDRIFEPFFRADPSRSRDSGGAGLGLSIVSAVVAAHGGRVQVKETSGGGATFEVELPLPSRPS